MINKDIFFAYVLKSMQDGSLAWKSFLKVGTQS